MEELIVYSQLGFTHISDVKGYDHILFIITLCALYKVSEWKRVLLLVTAFTLGHSITLSLAAFHIVIVNAYLVELLIPVTIFCTSILNLFYKNKNSFMMLHYAMATVFGLIHGMGFSNFFNSISIDGAVLVPLLGFNIGLEAGQILIVVLFFFTYMMVSFWKKINHQHWKTFFSVLGASVSVFLIAERI